MREEHFVDRKENVVQYSAVALRRAELGLTQIQLAEICGVAVTTIQRIESGHAEPKAETLLKIAKALDVPWKSLVDSSGHQQLPPTDSEAERKSNHLPAQSKPAMISADEYVKLNNKMMEQQQKIEQLTGQLSEAQQRYNSAFYKQKSTVLAFFEYCIDRLKDTYPDYQPDWVAIAKAAKLPDAEKFLDYYKDFKLAWMEQFIESSDEKDMQPPAVVRK